MTGEDEEFFVYLLEAMNEVNRLMSEVFSITNSLDSEVMELERLYKL
jgi:hypothetical protein